MNNILTIEGAKKLTEFKNKDGFTFEALHEYHNAKGEIEFYVCRLKNLANGKKYFTPVHWNGKKYELSLPKDKKLKPLYKLPSLINSNGKVFIVEGELKADNLEMLGAVVVTSQGGANNASNTDWKPLQNREVIIWGDNDPAGNQYAQTVAKILNDLDCKVKIINLDELELEDGGDFIDWYKNNPKATLDDVLELPAIDLSEVEDTKENIEISYCSLDKYEPKPINWLIEPFFAKGKISCIAGDPGLGKSQITASIASIVSNGGIFPVLKCPVTKGNVIILSAEDDPADTLRPRLEATNANLSSINIINSVFREDNKPKFFSLEKDVDRLRSLAKRIGNVALIIIDPITAYLGGIDSHNNSEVRGVLAPLSELASEMNCAVIYISHLNKGNNTAINRISGSLAFVAAARSAYIVTKDNNEEGKRFFLPLKNNLGNDQEGLAYNIEGYEYESEAGTIKTSRIVWHSEKVNISIEEALNNKKEFTSDKAEDFLTEYLNDGEKPSTEIIAKGKEMNISEITLKRAKKELKIYSYRKVFSGKWFWSFTKLDKNDISAKGIINPCHTKTSPYDVNNEGKGLQGNIPTIEYQNISIEKNDTLSIREKSNNWVKGEIEG